MAQQLVVTGGTGGGGEVDDDYLDQYDEEDDGRQEPDTLFSGNRGNRARPTLREPETRNLTRANPGRDGLYRPSQQGTFTTDDLEAGSFDDRIDTGSYTATNPIRQADDRIDMGSYSTAGNTIFGQEVNAIDRDVTQESDGDSGGNNFVTSGVSLDGITDVAGGLVSGGQDAVSGTVDTATNVGGFSQQAFTGWQETTAETTTGIFNVFRGKETIPEASADVGRGIVSIFADDPEEWRESFRDEQLAQGNSVIEDRQEILQSLDDGDKLQASYQATKVGTEALFDAPGGSVQETTRDTLGAAGVGDDEDIRDAVSSAYEGWVGASDGAIETLTPGQTSEKAAKWTKMAFVDEPIRAVTTAFTGVDPEKGELGGRAEPFDLYFAPLDVVGAGSVAKGTAKLAKSSRFSGALSRSDEAAEAAGKASQSSLSSSDEIAESADQSTSMAGGFLRLFGRGADALSGARRSASTADEFSSVSRVDEGFEAPTSASNLNPVDEFATAGDQTLSGSQRSIGTSSEFGSVGEDLRGVDEVFEGQEAQRRLEGTTELDPGQAIRGPLGEVVEVNRADEGIRSLETEPVARASATGDELGNLQTQVAETATRGADEITERATQVVSGSDESTGPFDELFSASDNVENTRAFPTSATDDATQAADDAGGLFGRSTGDDASAFGFLSGGDESGSLVSRLTGSDEAATGASRTDEAADTTRVADESTVLDEAGQGADEASQSLSDTISNWWARRGRLQRGALGIGAATVGADILGYNPIEGAAETLGLGGARGPLENAPGAPGAGEASGYRTRPIDTYYLRDVKVGELFEVQENTGADNWENIGFAIFLSALPPETRESAQPQTIYVLTTGAEATRIDPITREPNIVPTPRFNTRDAADQAAETYIDRLETALQEARQDDETPGPGDGDDPSDHTRLQGGLTAPDEVMNGEAFEVEFQVRLTPADMQYQNRTSLALGMEDGLGKLAESNINIESGSEVYTGTYQVDSGWSAQPGDYPLFGIVVEDGEQLGFADTTITVAPDEDNQGEAGDDGWGEAQSVRELPGGWILFVQEKINGEETRFLVAGKNNNDERIYIQPRGQVAKEPHFFPTADKAVAAHQAWVERVQSGTASEGEIPSSASGRPSPGGVTRDTRRRSKGASGLLDKASNFARERPFVTAAVSAVGLYVLWYAYKEGYFGEAYNTVKNTLGRVTP